MKNTHRTWRLWTALSVFTLIPLAVAAATVAHQLLDEDEHELDVRDVVGEARIGLGQAIAVALQARPGRAVEAMLEGEVEQGKKKVFFEVMVVGTDHALYEVKIDPVGGKVLTMGRESGEEELCELRGFVTALRHADLSLAQLVIKAEEILKGTPVSAELEYGHGGPMCDVLFANGRYLVEACLEARAGHLVEIELEGEELGRDEENDDGDDDEDEDEEDDDDDDGDR